MWLSTITFDTVAINNNMHLFDQVAINDKKQELKAIDGAGGSIAGWGPPDDLSTIPPDTKTIVIKRAWNTQSAAQEFVDFLNETCSNLVIASTVEEQV